MGLKIVSLGKTLSIGAINKIDPILKEVDQKDKGL